MEVVPQSAIQAAKSPTIVCRSNFEWSPIRSNAACRQTYPGDLLRDRPGSTTDAVQAKLKSGTALAGCRAAEPGQQFADAVTPSLRTATSISATGRARGFHQRRRQAACSIPCLALGVAQSVFALGFAASWHGSDFRCVTHCNGPDGAVCFSGSAAVFSGLRRLSPSTRGGAAVGAARI
jgi:hypothetical protein